MSGEVKLIALELVHAKIVARLHAHCFAEHWSAPSFIDLMRTGQRWGLLALIGDVPVGFILCQDVDGEAEIIVIGTHPDYRRQGIAQALLDESMVQVKAMFLEVAEDNPEAICFYQKNEFEEIGKRAKYYKRANGEKVDALVMKCST